MNDTIYRRDAIQALVDTEEIKGFAYKMLEDRLIGLPSASGWIPCSERLPKEDGFYLVTITDGEQITVCKMPFVDSEWKGNWFDDEVIAWMPLPESWKGADDE